MRGGQRVEWFVNGQEYFDRLLEVLPKARFDLLLLVGNLNFIPFLKFLFRKRIFISDWAFSPELYLKRENPLKEEHKLETVSILNCFLIKHIEILLSSSFKAPHFDCQ